MSSQEYLTESEVIFDVDLTVDCFSFKVWFESNYQFICQTIFNYNSILITDRLINDDNDC